MSNPTTFTDDITPDRLGACYGAGRGQGDVRLVIGHNTHDELAFDISTAQVEIFVPARWGLGRYHHISYCAANNVDRLSGDELHAAGLPSRMRFVCKTCQEARRLPRYVCGGLARLHALGVIGGWVASQWHQVSPTQLEWFVDHEFAAVLAGLDAALTGQPWGMSRRNGAVLPAYMVAASNVQGVVTDQWRRKTSPPEDWEPFGGCPPPEPSFILDVLNGRPHPGTTLS